MDLGLAGRVVIVTGASSGIGLAAARRLVEEGSRVVACARREPELRAAFHGMGDAQLLLVAGDVNDQDDMNHLVASAMEAFGRLDGVACVAGRGRHGHALELRNEEWTRELDTKVSGVINLVRAARPHLAANSGRVVTITAPTSRDPEPSMAAVSAGRAAIASLTRSLALDLVADGIAVNSVSVGFIDTPRQRSRHDADESATSYSDWVAQQVETRAIPMKRAGTSDEVAALIVLALAPILSYTTASTLAATGGLATE